MSSVLREHLEQIISLTEEEYGEVIKHFVSKKFKKHQFVVQENSQVEYEYFVVRGLLKASYFNAEGKEHILQFAMENWWVSDYTALTNQSKATLTIDCLEDTELLCITFEDKKNLCAASHKIEHFFRMKSNSGYMALQRRILSLLNNDAQSRYQELLELYPILFQRVPKALIASYLGVSRETLSRFSK